MTKLDILWFFFSIGIPGLVICAVIFFFGWPVVISFVSTRIGKIILGITLFFLLLISVFFKGKIEGEKIARLKQRLQAKKEIERAEKDRENIDNMSDDELDRKLSDWGRAD